MTISNMTVVNLNVKESREYLENYFVFLYPEKDFSCLVDFTKSNTLDHYRVIVTMSSMDVVRLAPTYRDTCDENGNIIDTTVEHHFDESPIIDWSRVSLFYGEVANKTEYENSWKNNFKEACA